MSNSVVRNQKAKLAADYNDLLKDLASPKLKSIGCYSLKETIGKGSYGKVKLGVHQLTCRLVAIKKINKKHAHLMAREIHHHRQLNHPNIVSLYEILSTETNIFIVSEHCPHGDLFDALARKGRFSEQHTKKWFLQLLDAIEYCHSLGIIHRDLKLENILLDQQDNVKICDFGFARQTDKNQLLKTFCGSLAYSAPEVIQRQNYSGPATDVWSLGIILYSLLAGELPFDDDCESALQRKVTNMEYIIPPYFSLEVTDLIRRILKFDPFERLTINQIIQHPWLNNPTVCLPQAKLTSSLDQSKSKQHEQSLVNSLLDAGFDSSVVEDMRSNHFGMRGTLWTMLLKSHDATIVTPDILLPNITGDTQSNHSDDWIGTLKSWFISKPNHNNYKPWSAVVSPKSSLTGAVQQHKFMMKTMSPILTSPSVADKDLGSEEDTKIKWSFSEKTRPPAFKHTVLPLIPMHPTKENDGTMVNISSTCSSAADDEYDDDQSSTISSPATSVAEDDDEKKSMSDIDSSEATHSCNMTAFHRVSPMPSRADVLLPRSSRYPIDDRQTNLRNRLGNKIIIEEEEEEE